MYTPILFSLTPAEQVMAFAVIIIASALIFRGDLSRVTQTALGASVFWIGAVFLSGFKIGVSIWAPFVMLPYFLLGFAVFLGVVFVIDR